MPIPTQSEMFVIVLREYADGVERTRREMKDHVAAILGLTDEERTLLTNRGTPIYESRVAWAVSHLKNAGFIIRAPERPAYHITDAGKDALQAGDDKAILRLINHTAERNTEIRKQQETKNAASPSSPAEASQSEAQSPSAASANPIELIDNGERALNQQLAADLMERIMGIEGRAGDTFFERLVTKLLAHLGYGAGHVTPASNDGGIDGIITTDALGFDPIYVQAKRYAKDHPVGRPEIQQFAGALGSVTHGAFITTSTFTSGAQKFARDYPHATISLIDGDRLTELMIEHDLGVATERVVRIKRLDSDFFEE